MEEKMQISGFVYASCTALVARPVAKIFDTWVSQRYVAATVSYRRV